MGAHVSAPACDASDRSNNGQPSRESSSLCVISEGHKNLLHLNNRELPSWPRSGLLQMNC